MRRIIWTLLVAVLGASGSALADKPGKGRVKDHKARGRTDVDITVVFGSHEREVARGFFVESYGRGNCPPGLAKKHNGCLPPGQAKKRYVIGQRLPSVVVVLDLPLGLATRIGPPPRGYRYGIVDGDLLKLAVGTLLVVDAIDGLVH